MAITFSVFKKSYADNLSDSDFQNALKTDLDALNATTVYSIQMEHLNGFWVMVCTYSTA
jgi:hypothetical protein